MTFIFLNLLTYNKVRKILYFYSCSLFLSSNLLKQGYRYGKLVLCKYFEKFYFSYKDLVSKYKLVEKDKYYFYKGKMLLEQLGLQNLPPFLYLQSTKLCM